MTTKVIKLARQIKNVTVTMLLSMLEETGEPEEAEELEESDAEYLPTDNNGRSKLFNFVGKCIIHVP